MAGDERLERWLNAEKCLGLAHSFNDRERKRIMLRMANAWLTLAEQHLRNTKLVCKTPTPCAKAPDDLK
jgi:hypothetical protein